MDRCNDNSRGCIGSTDDDEIGGLGYQGLPYVSLPRWQRGVQDIMLEMRSVHLYV